MQPEILIACARPESPRYREALELAGGRAEEVYCPSASLVEDYDGLVVTGGGDIHPDLFAEEDLGVSSNLDINRDRAEEEVISAFLNTKKPILTICRGAQMLNVTLGGTLVQDLSPEYRSTHKAEKGYTYHNVTAEKGSFLEGLYGLSSKVNSLHHQAIDRMGKGMIPCQWAEDGIIEGFYVEGYPAWGVQWHPERLCNPAYRPEDAVDGLVLFQWWMEQVRRSIR